MAAWLLVKFGKLLGKPAASPASPALPLGIQLAQTRERFWFIHVQIARMERGEEADVHFGRGS